MSVAPAVWLWMPVMALAVSAIAAGSESTGADSDFESKVLGFCREFCLDCHGIDEPSGDFDLESLRPAAMKDHRESWEWVVAKLRSRQMPPPYMPRPEESDYEAVLSLLERSLDRIADDDPRPGRTAPFRRLTRLEYQNAIRDLLDLRIDAARLLPRDESSHAFDNASVGELPATLLNRYLSSAQKISALAVGASWEKPEAETIRVRPDLTQDVHLPGLPVGTRGGVLFAHHFPREGQYEVRVRLARDRNEHVEGLREEHHLEIMLDRRRMDLFSVKPPPKGEADHSRIDAHLTSRFHVDAGPHALGVAFLKQSSSLQETIRQPYQAHFNMHRHPRIGPAVYQVTVTGPYEPGGPGDTPSRRRIFLRRPSGSGDEDRCAAEILSVLARRAWRRPVDGTDLATPLTFFRLGRDEGGFDHGIESALAALLVSPHFLFRIEPDPPGAAPGEIYRLSDLQLASRLSFFLWSSIPDDELLELASRGELSEPEVLEKQVRRMLADERSRALVTNFAGQWLYLRNLDSVHPDMRLFPDFDDNLRQAMRAETELLFESILREDRSVLDLVAADYTYLNERLAKHYGIRHVHGSRFRRVELDEESRRGGLLRHGSILTVTSYATRTSPVVRGHWILKNLIGSPPPPPPPDVPALADNTVAAGLTLRERLAQHRADQSCAVCHDVIDPVGFPLENFDAVGRWRDLEAALPIDASGGLPDGTEFTGVDGLERGLLARPEQVVATVAEKLLAYAVGRGVDWYDAPAIRRIVREARAEDYRFSALVLGVARSIPFQMRTAE